MRATIPISFAVASLSAGCVSTEPLVDDTCHGCAMRDLVAPAGLSFETVRSVAVALDPEHLRGLGEPAFVKVALDPELTNTLFLGRVNVQGTRLSLSVPRTSEVLFAEAYDGVHDQRRFTLEVER